MKQNMFSVCVRWTMVDGGARKELPLKDRMYGDAKTGREAVAVADRLMKLVCELRGKGAVASIVRNKDGAYYEVCRYEGLKAAWTIDWRAQLGSCAMTLEGFGCDKALVKAVRKAAAAADPKTVEACPQ